MFMYHIALSLCFIALTAGSALYMFSAGSKAKGARFAKLIAAIVIFLSITSSLCTMYYGMKFWRAANTQCPMCMAMHDEGTDMQNQSMLKSSNAINMSQNKNSVHIHKH